MNQIKQTPLYQQHLEANAKMVDFGGWSLPVHFGSQIDEHHAVRKDCGMFDVSHMTAIDVKGKEAIVFFSWLLANDINKITQIEGKALYSCMLNQDGGVIDDLIVYHLDAEHFRMVTNASTRERDLAWLIEQSDKFDVRIEEQPALALVAVQGPNAIAKASQALDNKYQHTIENLKRFQGRFTTPQDDNSAFVARTGYTGEDGLEIILNAKEAVDLWVDLARLGVARCGLGARDTLRLEAGMSLHGNDLDEQHTPLQSGLAWSVSITDERDFCGKQAILSATTKHLVGVRLIDKGIARSGQSIEYEGEAIGQTTSGGFSPTLAYSIGLARITGEEKLPIGTKVNLIIRGKPVKAEVARSPFVKNGQATN